MLDLRLLGALDLRTDEGVEVRSVLAQPKRVALLAYLVLHAPGGYVRRDSLLALFWPESDTERARSSLRNGLSYLRRSLGEGVVLTRGDEEVGIELARLRCDAVEFRRALEEGAPARALELYRGDLLEGFFLSGAAEYEEWMEGQRAELRAQACGAAWALAFEAEEAGQGERAAACARRAVALARNEEPAVRKLIVLLGRLGEREAALQAYRELVERLLREYGAEPSAETRAVVEEVRAAAAPAPGPSAALTPLAGARTPLPILGEGLRDLSATEASQRAPDQSPLSQNWERGLGGEGLLPPARTQSPLSRKRERGLGGEGVVGERGLGGEGVRGGGGRRAPQLALLLLAVVVAVTAATLLGRERTPAAPPVSANVIAVLPFSYHGSGESQALEEGIIRLLSTNLDGAGELRSVDARALLSVIEHTGVSASDPESGRRLAERFGAGLFVLGHIVEAGGRLRITAVIYERTGAPGGAPLEQVTVEGESEQLFPLVDELTTQLLARRSREPQARIARLAALTTHSLPALRSFLDGEQHYRRGRYGEAVEAFRQAVGLDTTFALAYYRMSTAAIWASDWEADRVGREGAMRFRERLAPRDRQVVEAWERYSGEPTAELEQLYEMLVARDPDDLEAWFQLGETRFHWTPMFGYPVLEAREPFARVLSYEPKNVPALIHLVRLAAIERDIAAFDALFERIRQLDPGLDQLLEVEAVRAFTLGDRPAQAQLRPRLAALEPEVRMRILYSVATYTGDLEGTAALARQLSELPTEPRWSAAMHILLAQLEAGRGRWRVAREELAALERLRPSWATHYRGILGTLPFLRLSAAELETIRSEVERMPASSTSPSLDVEWWHPMVMYSPGQLYLMGVLSARRSDPVAALRYAGELERQPSPQDAAYGRIFARLLRAEVARAGGQTADALKEIGGTPRSAEIMSLPAWRFANGHERFLRAELLQALGRDEEALRIYASFPAPSANDLYYLAPSHLRRAEIHERRGERAQAAAHYGRFLELWRDADPELQPLVRQARGRLEELEHQGSARRRSP